MTITPTIHQVGRKDAHVDRRVDVDIDAGQAGSTPTTPAARTAFVIVLANHKGGVTKTTSTANFGAMLASAQPNRKHRPQYAIWLQLASNP